MQDREIDMTEFQEHGKTIILWSDLIGVNMGGGVGSAAFVSFHCLRMLGKV